MTNINYETELNRIDNEMKKIARKRAYQQRKVKIVSDAVDFKSLYFWEDPLSYEEVEAERERFAKLAKQYGLTTTLRAMGVIH